MWPVCALPQKSMDFRAAGSCEELEGWGAEGARVPPQTLGLATQARLTAIRLQTPPVGAPIFTLFSHVHWFSPYRPPGVQYDFPKRPGRSRIEQEQGSGALGLVRSPAGHSQAGGLGSHLGNAGIGASSGLDLGHFEG